VQIKWRVNEGSRPLPDIKDHPVRLPRQTVEAETGDMDPKKILIVDDELSILVPLKFLLEKNSYSVELAQSGRDAIDLISQSKPDLILLDIMLPDLDGYEIFQMIRQNPDWDDIKVIYLSAKNRDVDIAKGLNLGVDAYVTKPFSNADLVEKVRKLVGSPV
jgi:DNA-binding response OmpR family regulator